MARDRFKECVFDVIVPKVTQALLVMIKQDRDGEEVDREAIQHCLQIYIQVVPKSVKTYQFCFQTDFLKTTEGYYTREAARWLANDSLSGYLMKVEMRLIEERERLKECLHKSSEEPLFLALNNVLLTNNQQKLLFDEPSGLKDLLEKHAVTDLARLFQLSRAVPASLNPIATCMKKHIISLGSMLLAKVNQAKKDETYIQDLIILHVTYYDLVRVEFQGHAAFHKALKEAFVEVCNESVFSGTTAELLSGYTDKLLRKGGVKMDEKQLENAMENCVRIFAYLTDKDIFSEFYRKLLAKRLLLQRSSSYDAEKAMIGKLKFSSGAQFTSKLEGMFLDMQNASTQQLQFTDHVRDSSISLPCEFTVQTLTTGCWPSYKSDNLQISSALQIRLKTFESFYHSKHSNRKLTWIHSLGEITLVGKFRKQKHELVLSVPQAVTLLLFNEKPELAISDIITMTGLTPDVVKQQIRLLVKGKYQILMKKPSDGYKPDHRLRVNRNFTCPQRRIRLPNAIQKTSQNEKAQSTKTVREDRKHAVEASIVRVMKIRQSLKHQQLILEVSQQLMPYFQPDIRQIKERIQDLIEREYLRRDEEQSFLYHYLA